MPRSLRNKAEFARIYAEGVKRVGRLLVLYLLATEGDAQAVVASRKIGNAVQRNRAKRLLREALRAVVFRPDGLGAGERGAAALDAQPGSGAASALAQGLWAVAVARQAIVGARCQEVQQEMEQLLLP
jgi:RNase P protein component